MSIACTYIDLQKGVMYCIYNEKHEGFTKTECQLPAGDFIDHSRWSRGCYRYAADKHQQQGDV